MKFTVEQQVLDLGVKIRGVQITGVNNYAYTKELHNYLENHIESLFHDESKEAIKENIIIQGFYDLHKKVNIPRRKNPPASENLLLTLIKKQGFFYINPIVDIYNIISMETKLALGAHDMNKIKGHICLKLTQGNENYVPLGQEKPKEVVPNVYSYIDDANDIICYLEIRQVDKTKVTRESTNIFYIVQGNEQTSQDYVDDVATELIRITTHFCGGTGQLL